MAHSWNHTSIAGPRGRAARTFSSSVAKPFSERLQRFGVLRMVAGPRREPDMAELSEFPAHGRFVKRDRKFRMEPQIPHEATGPGRSAASARPRGPPASERPPRSPQAPDVGCRRAWVADPRRQSAPHRRDDRHHRSRPAPAACGSASRSSFSGPDTSMSPRQSPPVILLLHPWPRHPHLQHHRVRLSPPWESPASQPSRGLV